jgi:hypothetical protein
MRTAPAEAEKYVNGDVLLGPELMNSPVPFGINIAILRVRRAKNNGNSDDSTC